MLKAQTPTDLILVVGAMHAGTGVHKGPPGGIADCSLRTSQDPVFSVPVLAFQSLWKSKPHLSQEVIWSGN